MDVNTLLKSDNGCHFSFTTKCQNGFTLLELLVTLSIVAALGFILPSISAALLYSNNIAVVVNKIAGDMSYARSEAVSRGQNVELCKSLNGIECIRTAQWESGWMIFVDENKNRKRELTEQRLRFQPAINTVNITYRGSASSHYIRFRPDGATGVNGTFAFCSDSEGQYKKALILFRTGRLRLSNTRTKGKAISCASYRK